MTADRIVPLTRILDVRPVVAAAVHRTPILSSATAAAIIAERHGIRVADGRVHLKAEHLQKTGSFKPRGMTARVAALTPDERRRGIITISAGNAAQGYAFAGATAGVPVTVVMQAAAVRSKVDATRGYGAEVILEGADTGEAFAAMERIASERGLVFCHPWDDPDVIAGHGSVGLEILEDIPDVDVVVVGIGGGGLISGVAAAIRERRPNVRVFGVEPETSDAMSRALEAGSIVRIVPASVADGLNAPFAGEWSLAMCRRYLEGVIRIDDGTILAGLRFAAERLKQVLEPAGAAALGALLAGAIPVRDGDRVCVVLSGGNVATSRLGEFFAGDAGR